MKVACNSPHSRKQVVVDSDIVLLNAAIAEKHQMKKAAAATAAAEKAASHALSERRELVDMQLRRRHCKQTPCDHARKQIPSDPHMWAPANEPSKDANGVLWPTCRFDADAMTT